MRTAEKVIIKATEQSTKLAKEALSVQDACNPIAVTNLLLSTQKHFLTGVSCDSYGSDMAIQNPISLAILNKLNDLAGCNNSDGGPCFPACMLLESGIDVEWEVNILR